MGKFDGILLCTDLDGTLLNSECQVSRENIDAIKYFMENGGKFTFVTGRVPHGAKLVAEFVRPNAPGIVFNGAGLFDFEKDELLWGVHLPEDCVRVIEYAEEKMPEIGLIVCTDQKVHFSKMNPLVHRYMIIENLPLDTTPYTEVPHPWTKVIFIESTEKVDEIKEHIENSHLYPYYDFVKSCSVYYEMMPKGATKGTGLLELAKMLDIQQKRIIAVGDNENDVSMIEAAGLGIAVENSKGRIRDIADMMTVSNNDHAIAKIINDLDTGKIVV